jgi:Uma2 family endonuclease
MMGSVPPDPARLARPPDPGLGRRVSVEAERTVDAPMERVWALLRDYRVARPRLLTEHFSDYAVQKRGDGAGTVIEYELRVGRHQGRHVLAVQEPVPGRMLRERDRTSALLSTWTLTPGGEGERTVVRLAVALRDPQIAGWRACGRGGRCAASAGSCSRASTRNSAASDRRPGADRPRDLERPSSIPVTTRRGARQRRGLRGRPPTARSIPEARRLATEGAHPRAGATLDSIVTVATVAHPRLDSGEYLALQAAAGWRSAVELIGGEAVVTPPSGGQAASAQGELFFALRRWQETAGDAGLLLQDVFVRLPGENYLAPDLAWWTAARRPTLVQGALDVVPDLVVEVLSPATRANDLGAKRDVYVAAGVRELWLADPGSATVTAVRPDGRQETVGHGDRLTSRLLPGFAVDIARLFLA